MEIGRMDYRFTALLIVMMCLLTFFLKPAHSAETQTNVSGSNTSIEGGYTGGATTYQSGSSSNTTTNSTSNSNIKSSPPTSSAPSYNSMTQDVCAVGGSLGVQTFGLGISGGKHFIDKNCERLKLARILNDFGMKVAAVAILCQDERVFESMIQAGTPCPIDGKIGKEAKDLWAKYDHERPDYNTYVKRMKDRERKEKAIAREKAIKEKKKAKEQAKMTKEFEKIDQDMEKEKIILPMKKPVKWTQPK